jgi:hypothetical protein
MRAGLSAIQLPRFQPRTTGKDFVTQRDECILLSINFVCASHSAASSFRNNLTLFPFFLGVAAKEKYSRLFRIPKVIQTIPIFMVLCSVCF